MWRGRALTTAGALEKERAKKVQMVSQTIEIVEMRNPEIYEHKRVIIKHRDEDGDDT